MELTENAVKVLEKRYLKRDEKNVIIETPDEMFKRVAHHVALAENKYDDSKAMKWEDRFYWLMSKLYFLPNSPTLRHFGVTDGCGSACFVIPIEDSRDSIFHALGEAAKIQSMGGGTGYNFSKLRPRGSRVGNTGAVSSGPISFMEVFNHAISKVIRQGGVRDGAQMGIFNCDHTDIMEFITCKEMEGILEGFNISVAITDKFMEALNNKETFILNWKGKIAKKEVKIISKIEAIDLWNAIIEGAWKNGEPGVIFIDTINKMNPLRNYETIEAVNPCGENPLPPYGCCNLGSIDLSKMFVLETDSDDDHSINVFDWQLFEKVIRYSVRFLDNVIDVNNYPLPEIEEEVRKTRRIGLGIMGFADMLILLGVRYSSEKAVKWAEKIGSFISSKAFDESIKLAEEKEKINLRKVKTKSKMKHTLERRNGTLLSIAPTGTLSIIADCSSGIEPNFDVDYEKMAIDTKLHVIPRLWRNFTAEEEIPVYYETTKNIPPKQHVKILAAFQKYVDTGISKTVNAPNNTTKEEVDKLFRMAYETGCKAVTFYRDGSRQVQALTSKKKKKRERGNWVLGGTKRAKTGYGNVYITMNWIGENDLIEVFTHIGKSSSEVNCMTEAIGRLISLARKYEIPINEIVKQLKDIGGEKPILTKVGTIKSIPDAIARSIEEVFCIDKIENKYENMIFKESCPNCSGRLLFSEGCVRCSVCDYDKCGG